LCAAITSAACGLAALIAPAGRMARAETWPLELKRIEASSRAVVPPSDYLKRNVMPQSIHMQVGPPGETNIGFAQSAEQAAAFKRLVKKEPTYEAEFPLRGVVKLGSQEFAFALDAVPRTKAKEEQPKSPKRKQDAKKARPDSPAVDATKATKLSKAIEYNRLYFDLNHNGDLTDDAVVKAERPAGFAFRGNYAAFEFPRVDVTIDVDGVPVDYAFFLGGYVNVSQDFSYAGVSLTAGAYREGDIVLEGKKRHVVVLDFNSNGRFADEIALHSEIRTSTGQVYFSEGDKLLLDPAEHNEGYVSSYDVTTGPCQHPVSKLILIDDRYYDLEISPAGDRLTLTPATVPLGSVTNPNDGFCALLYSDRGTVKICVGKEPVPLPEGRWKLLAYTIDRTGWKETADSEEETTSKGKKAETRQSSLLESLTKALSGAAATRVQAMLGTPSTLVSANASYDCPAVDVRQGQTVALPFGPPYKPVVRAEYFNDHQAELGLSLVGAGGEICTALMVDGTQPAQPEFTIRDPQGKVVEQGDFEYG
jgi:hypothetical protein